MGVISNTSKNLYITISMNNVTDSYYNDTKEEVRSRVDIAHVIGRYVKLKPAGQNLKGSCPFHKEKNPSFTVNPSKEVFHCFGCGKGGDIFTFLMEIEGLTFPEALERLADEVGVAIRPFKQPSGESKQEHISKTESLKIHKIATQYYYDQMKNNEEAIAYLKSRKLTPDIVKEFQLGYAPNGWSNFTEYAKSKNIAEDKLLACGLVVSSSQGGAPYDRFRNRIIFPIFDLSGRPIAFGGRSMDENAMPKYLNSPDTNLYRKSRVLYGLHQARASIKEKGFAIFVEGYMDFLSLYQAGINNVVATSGTALTEEHGQLIRRFTSKIVLVFDGDIAGFDAAERAVFTLAPQSLDMHVLILPEGEDPDTYINNYSPDSFYESVINSDSAVQFIITRAMKMYNPETAKGKSSIVDHILPLIKSTTDTIMKAEYIKKVAEKLDIKEQLIYAKIPRKKKRGVQPQMPYPDTVPERFIETEEGSFLHIIVSEPKLIEAAQKHISTEIFTDPFIKNLYSLITQTYKDDKSLKSIIDRSDNNDVKKALSLMLIKEITSENHQEDLSHKVKRFLLKLNKKRMHENTMKIRNENNPDARKKLLHEQKVLITQRGDLVNKW